MPEHFSGKNLGGCFAPTNLEKKELTPAPRMDYQTLKKIRAHLVRRRAAPRDPGTHGGPSAPHGGPWGALRAPQGQGGPSGPQGPRGALRALEDPIAHTHVLCPMGS